MSKMMAFLVVQRAYEPEAAIADDVNIHVPNSAVAKLTAPQW